MSRRLRLPTKEMGDLEVLVIWHKDGKWEGEWASLEGTAIGRLFSQCTQVNLDHALHRYSNPMVLGLGIPPDLVLRKLPPAAKECHLRRTCSFYDKRTCFPTAKNMPWCYEPGGIVDDNERKTAAKAISFWREKVYLVVIPEEARA